LVSDDGNRDTIKWSQSIAVGSKSYVDNIKEKLGIKEIHRKTRPTANGFELRENELSYTINFDPQSEMDV
jgi:hypothetical protein